MRNTPVRNGDFRPLLKDIEVKFNDEEEEDVPSWLIDVLIALTFAGFTVLYVIG